MCKKKQQQQKHKHCPGAPLRGEKLGRFGTPGDIIRGPPVIVVKYIFNNNL